MIGYWWRKWVRYRKTSVEEAVEQVRSAYMGIEWALRGVDEKEHTTLVKCITNVAIQSQRIQQALKTLKEKGL